jgi:hypothetical protein
MKELFEYIGVKADGEAEPKWTDVKKVLEEKFVPIAQLGDRPDLLKPHIDESFGKLARKTQVSIVKTLKDNGLDAPHSEFEKFDKIDDLLPVVVKKFKDQIEQEAAKSASGDDKLKTKLEEVESERDRFKNLYETKESEFNEFKDKTAKSATQAKINGFKETLFSGVKFKKDITDLEKEGFRVKFAETYDIKLSDDGKFELKDKDGKTVYHPKKATEVLTPQAAIEIFAKENKVDDSAPYDGKKTQNVKLDQERREHQPPASTRKVNPRFSGHVAEAE